MEPKPNTAIDYTVLVIYHDMRMGAEMKFDKFVVFLTAGPAVELNIKGRRLGDQIKNHMDQHQFSKWVTFVPVVPEMLGKLILGLPVFLSRERI